MLWLIIEMVLALLVIVGIMVWTLRARTDHTVESLPSDEAKLTNDADENKPS